MIACVCLCFGLSGKRKRGWLPEFVYVLGRVVNKCGDGCPSLFTFWVEWETKVGMIARVCLRIGSSGKQKRECLPVFVYVLGGFGNKRGSACLCLFPFLVFW